MGNDKRVVVGVDASRDGAEALQWAADFADRIHADLVLVTAWQWPLSYGESPVWVDFEPEEEARTIVEKAKASLTRGSGTASTAVCEGRPGKVLVDMAEHASALVVGSRGHGAIVEAVLGSVSAYCVRHAHCTVVVVR